MRRQVLLDTGPLVAFLDRRDRYHTWAKQQWSETEPPLLTCESVLSEACFLLQRFSSGHRGVTELVERRIIEIPFRLVDHTVSVSRLMAKYAQVPMSLADACLVRMAELHSQSGLLTLDSDFKIYRKHGRQVLSVTMPKMG